MAEPKHRWTEPQRAWVAALRSGEYKQTQAGFLRRGDKFCCLGVACEVAIKAGVGIDRKEDEYFTPETGDHEETHPPELVQAWLGLKNGSATFGVADNLIDRNDKGASFAEIADLIEQHADTLFVSEEA